MYLIQHHLILFSEKRRDHFDIYYFFAAKLIWLRQVCLLLLISLMFVCLLFFVFLGVFFSFFVSVGCCFFELIYNNKICAASILVFLATGDIT